MNRQPRFKVVCLKDGQPIPAEYQTFKPVTRAAAEKECAAWQAHADRHAGFLRAAGKSNYSYRIDPVAV